MLKRLRIKIIVVNMVIATSLLCLVMGVLYSFMGRNLEIESIQTMRMMAMRPMNRDLSNPSVEDGYMPYYTILIDENGEIMGIGGGSFDMSDPELLQDIVNRVDETRMEFGTISEYSLRFLKMDEPFMRRIFFADISAEHAILGRILKNYILLFVLGFLCLLGLSILFARWTVKPVEKVWKQQKDFVADASHELKTPLTVIMTDSELLNSSECSEPDRMRLSGSIMAMARQMKGLVESLLDLARIDRGNLEGSTDIVALSDVMEDACMMFDPVFFENGMSFSYDISPGIVVNGNGTHLHQLADIFLDNAVKYASPKATVMLSLKGVSSKRCRLEVSNQGDPIPEAEQENLFKRFYRADKVRTCSKSYGLGLAIAQAVADEHKGRIWVENRDGFNRFIVEFPMSAS